MQAFQSTGRVLKAVSASVRVFLSDLGDGLLAVSHNSLALLGLVVLGGVIVIGGRADVRDLLEEQALDWLQARQEARFAPEPSEEEADMLAVDRAICEPRALILIDEPSKGLAPSIIQNLISAFKELKQQRTTLLLVEQNFNMAKALGDTVAVMDNGRVVHRGAMQELAEDEGMQQRLLGLSLGAHQ